MHALHNEELVVLTTQWLPWLLANWRGNSWEVQVLVTDNPRTYFGALQFIMIEPVMVAGDSLTNVCG